MVLDSPDTEKEGRKSGEEEGSGVEPCCDRKSPPLANLSKVVGRGDVLEES